MCSSDVLKILEELTERKAEAKKEPSYVLDVELYERIGNGKEVREVLNALWRDGKIKVGDTINHKYIELL